MGLFTPKQPEGIDKASQERLEMLATEIGKLSGHVAELQGKLTFAQEEAELRDKLMALQEEVSALEITKSEITEKHEREKREIEHMVGLEKSRQEQELELGRREAELDAREANLTAEKKRFEDNLEFNNERFEKMETYLTELAKALLDRLPDVTLKATATAESRPSPSVKVEVGAEGDG